MAMRTGLKQLIRVAGQRPTALSPGASGVALRSGASAVLSHAHSPMAIMDGPMMGDSVRCANLKAISDRMRSVGYVYIFIYIR